MIGLIHEFLILMGKHYRLLPHIVRTVARTSLVRDCQNARVSHLADSKNASFLAVWTLKKPVS